MIGHTQSYSNSLISNTAYIGDSCSTSSQILKLKFIRGLAKNPLNTAWAARTGGHGVVSSWCGFKINGMYPEIDGL